MSRLIFSPEAQTSRNLGQSQQPKEMEQTQLGHSHAVSIRLFTNSSLVSPLPEQESAHFPHATSSPKPHSLFKFFLGPDLVLVSTKFLSFSSFFENFLLDFGIQLFFITLFPF